MEYEGSIYILSSIYIPVDIFNVFLTQLYSWNICITESVKPDHKRFPVAKIGINI